MNRALWLWLPQWPLQRLSVARPELNGRTVVLYEAPSRGGLQVVMGGESLGIYPGMPLAEATAMATEEAAAGGSKGLGVVGLGARGRSNLASVREPSPPGRGQGEGDLSRGESLTPTLSQREREQEDVEVHDGSLHLEAYDPIADRAALVELAEWCERFSPTVAVEAGEQPDGLALDVSGLGPLFGGEEVLAQQIVTEAGQRGLVARVAIADTIGAAWGVAHYGVGGVLKGTVPFCSEDSTKGDSPWIAIVPPSETLAALALLPIAALRLPPDTVELLAAVGIDFVRQLTALPRTSLSVRFGEPLLRQLDRATGDLAELVAPHRAEPQFTARWSFESPTEYSEGLERVLEELVRRVTVLLAARGEGVVGLVCRIQCENRIAEATPWIRLPLGLFQPTASAMYLWELLRLQLETLRLEHPVAELRVEVTATAPLAQQQQELFAPKRYREAQRHLTTLVERLSSRLGREAVCQPSLLADAQPEYASVDLPWTGVRQLGRGTGSLGRSRKKTGPHPGPLPKGEGAGRRHRQTAPGTRPVWLTEQPAPVSVLSIGPSGPPAQFHWDGVDYRIARSWGPQRIETGWWRTACVRRDYYRVETAAGQRFWLFRQNRSGHWFLHGEFG